jgi:tRNA pseudouridine38-40 synthase
MSTFKITVAYDGTDYVGWQRQANGLSIQALLEDALRALDGRDVVVAGAGRTDAGVHALGQVAAFTIVRAMTPDALIRALNAHLPHGVRVLSADDVPPSFHPRFDARAKTYRYRLWNDEVMSPFERGTAWHVPGPLDLAAMCAAARLVEGRHNFAAFQAAGSDVATTVRTIVASTLSAPLSTGGADSQETGVSGELDRGTLLVYEVTGDGFLRHMVRIIVGSLVEIGRGRQPVEWIGRALASRDRTSAGPTAPPHGLFLVRVRYPDSLAAGS